MGGVHPGNEFPADECETHTMVSLRGEHPRCPCGGPLTVETRRGPRPYTAFRLRCSACGHDQPYDRTTDHFRYWTADEDAALRAQARGNRAARCPIPECRAMIRIVGSHPFLLPKCLGCGNGFRSRPATIRSGSSA